MKSDPKFNGNRKPKISLTMLRDVTGLARVREYGCNKYKSDLTWRNMQDPLATVEAYVDAAMRHLTDVLEDARKGNFASRDLTKGDVIKCEEKDLGSYLFNLSQAIISLRLLADSLVVNGLMDEDPEPAASELREAEQAIRARARDFDREDTVVMLDESDLFDVETVEIPRELTVKVTRYVGGD